EYIALHADLELAFQDRPWGSLNHYLSGGMSEARTYCEAQLYGAFSPPDEIYDENVIDDLGDKVPLCVLVHLYYPEMWDELKEYIERIDVAFDLYVNLVESTWTTEAIANIRTSYPEGHIQISPNEGRDIGGFFRLLDHVDFKRYVAFTMMHSKKSPHVSAQYAAIWKKNLLGAILGDRTRIRQNIAAFIQDTGIGIIGAVRTRHTSMEQNLDRMGRLFDIYQISEENRDCEYVSGTMMMVRSEVMRAVYEPMKSYKFLTGDGKGLDHHVDGQLEHSIERIFGNVMKECGCRFLWR
ncbi:hypothetical protein LWE61_17830, partial [Sphingobium sufflavum]|uniref:rhamnan synthesis F family protein n=1 Tax=Sphingobium sufflavum TaxID=1129547 RepID=UPI001F303785